MRAPEFWSGRAKGRDRVFVLQALLAPMGFLYGEAAAARQRWTKPAHVSVPVLCVGNLTLGGAGKTPIARALRARLGASVHVLLRGYGGAAKGPLRVDREASFRMVGDEALLHAADGPTWISRDRVAGAQAAVEAGARLIIMDDGFQNPTLYKDLSIVAVDAQTGVGNGKIFPAGPLRERLTDGVARADALIMMDSRRSGAEHGASPHARDDGPPPCEVLDEALATRGLRASLRSLGDPPAGPIVAFAGIGRPMKFFDALKELGADLVEAAPFPDHHAFSASDLDWLAKLAAERNASLLTTEKDHVRLDAHWRARVGVLKVQAQFADEAALEALLGPLRERMR
jgi:tetraacyldisaccharide 4'-kinase